MGRDRQTDKEKETDNKEGGKGGRRWNGGKGRTGVENVRTHTSFMTSLRGIDAT